MSKVGTTYGFGDSRSQRWEASPQLRIARPNVIAEPSAIRRPPPNRNALTLSPMPGGPPTCKRVRGFSLIEVVVATFLVGIVLTLLAVTIPRSLLSQQQGTQRSFALQLSLHEIERVRSQDPATNVPDSTVTGPDGASFGVHDDIEAIAPFTSDQLQLIKVTVRWLDHGHPRELHQECRVTRVRS